MAENDSDIPPDQVAVDNTLSTDLEGYGEPDLQPRGLDGIKPFLSNMLDNPETLDAEKEEDDERRRLGEYERRSGKKIPKIHPEEIRAKMRCVTKHLFDGSQGKIPVESLAMKIYRIHGLKYRIPEPGVFIDDIIQQMTLIILVAPKGQTKSYYADRALKRVRDFVISRAFNPDNEHTFASRKGVKVEAEYYAIGDKKKTHRMSRLIFVDNWDKLESVAFQEAGGHEYGFQYGVRCQPFLGLAVRKYLAMKAAGKLCTSELALIEELLQGSDLDTISLDENQNTEIDWDHVDDVIKKRVSRWKAFQLLDCSIPSRLRWAIQLAQIEGCVRGWQWLFGEFAEFVVDNMEAVYEEYWRVAFEAVGPCRSRAISRCCCGAGSRRKNLNIFRKIGFLSDDRWLCPKCWPTHTELVHSICPSCTYVNPRNTE